ncbi:MAG: cell division topological specificity factor MinE [Anaerolineae bacterium]|nr:cell division topological specificity factor MinE [Thermoflexales bacterium]MDW8394857.1 cell division topological specificity factor MinE [Anaerolineae bacterium]
MGLIDRFFSNKPNAPSTDTGSAAAARQRLQFVLVHDRAEIPPATLNLIKDDIIAVLSRRIRIDREHVSVQLTYTENESRLVVDIPLLTEALSDAPGRARGSSARPATAPRPSSR